MARSYCRVCGATWLRLDGDQELVCPHCEFKNKDKDLKWLIGFMVCLGVIVAVVWR